MNRNDDLHTSDSQPNDRNEPATDVPIVSFGERRSPHRDYNAEGPQPDDHETANDVHPLRLYIVKLHTPENGGFTLSLPSSQKALRSFLAGIEVSDWQDIVIMEIQSDIVGLGEKLNATFAREDMSPNTLNELNYLATKIEAMHPESFEVFAATLEAKHRQSNISDVINLAENTGRFYLQPAFYTEDYDAFFIDLNKSFMEQAENPQPDMLRATLPAAKDILTRGEAIVYRLMPEGPKELSKLDALSTRGDLWYSNYREFAVKEVSGLDKWAERTAKSLTAPPPEREKPRSREPEI